MNVLVLAPLVLGWFLFVAGPISRWINRRILRNEGYGGWELWRRALHSRVWTEDFLSEENRGFCRAFKALLGAMIACFVLALALALLPRTLHESGVLVYWPAAIYLVWTLFFAIPTLKMFDYQTLKNKGHSGIKLWLMIFSVVRIKRCRKGPISDRERGFRNAYVVTGMVSMVYFCVSIFLIVWLVPS
jgi:hypothetical protein